MKEIKVFHRNKLGWTVLLDGKCMSTNTSFKQAQKNARRALWQMNAEIFPPNRFVGQIHYGRKADRMCFMIEYVSIDKHCWKTIKSERQKFLLKV